MHLTFFHLYTNSELLSHCKQLPVLFLPVSTFPFPIYHSCSISLNSYWKLLDISYLVDHWGNLTLILYKRLTGHCKYSILYSHYISAHNFLYTKIIQIYNHYGKMTIIKIHVHISKLYIFFHSLFLSNFIFCMFCISLHSFFALFFLYNVHIILFTSLHILHTNSLPSLPT